MAMSAAGLGGQSITDRVNAARYALAGQGLARVVCKATTEEILGPKKKHLDYLLQCTHEPNVSIPSLANLLIERTQNNSWVVVFKSLITVHHLMCYGNERFTQYLATSNCTFNLTNFLDKSLEGMQMSTFIRRYAKYINAKAYSYRVVGADFAKMKRGTQSNSSSSSSVPASSSTTSGSESLRSMSGDKILKTLPVLQSQVDSMLEFDAHPRDLNNGVVTAAFMLLYRDLIRLFACFNDGIINLLEKFFSFKGKKECREALELYKKFLIRMDRVAEFLKTAEAVGIDKGEIPDLTRAPSSLLEALEAHCLQMEGKDPLAISQEVKTRTAAFQQQNHLSQPLSKEEAYKKALEEEAEFLSKIEREKKLKSGQPLTSEPSSSSSSNSNNTQQNLLIQPVSSGNNHAPSKTSQLTGSSGVGSESSADDFNAFMMMGDPIEETSTGAGGNKKKVAEEILALFEQNAQNASAVPYFHQTQIHNPYMAYPMGPSAASSNPFATGPVGMGHPGVYGMAPPGGVGMGHRPPQMMPGPFPSVSGSSGPFSPPGLMTSSVSAPGFPSGAGGSSFTSSPHHMVMQPQLVSSGSSLGFSGHMTSSSSNSGSSFEPNFASAFPTNNSSPANNSNNSKTANGRNTSSSTAGLKDANSLLKDFSFDNLI